MSGHKDFLETLDSVGNSNIPKINAEGAVRAFRDGTSDAVLADYRQKYGR